jgi:glycosyltransferase involved in cell wall biosynthesis
VHHPAAQPRLGLRRLPDHPDRLNRPAVSVVVPFRGDRAAAERLGASLARLRRLPGDELIVADNTSRGVASAALDGGVTVAGATRERSSYHARNAGARVASREWLLFMDADCIPAPDLLEAYFAEPVAERCGALAGRILPLPGQGSLAARYARARRFVEIPQRPGAIPTAPAGNLLVRRAAFEAVRGFAEGIRSAGDVDFCRRVQAVGYTLELRAAAAVIHPHADELSCYLRTVARYAAGARWLDARYPGIAPRWPLWLELRRAGVDSARLWMRGDLDESTFRALDGLSLIAHNVGYRSSNGVREVR